MAEAGAEFGVDEHALAVAAGLAFALPALAAGAAAAGNRLNQHVFSARHAAIAGKAGTTLPPSRCQPLMPVLT